MLSRAQREARRAAAAAAAAPPAEEMQVDEVPPPPPKAKSSTSPIVLDPQPTRIIDLTEEEEEEEKPRRRFFPRKTDQSIIPSPSPPRQIIIVEDDAPPPPPPPPVETNVEPDDINMPRPEDPKPPRVTRAEAADEERLAALENPRLGPREREKMLFANVPFGERIRIRYAMAATFAENKAEAADKERLAALEEGTWILKPDVPLWLREEDTGLSREEFALSQRLLQAFFDTFNTVREYPVRFRPQQPTRNVWRHRTFTPDELVADTLSLNDQKKLLTLHKAYGWNRQTWYKVGDTNYEICLTFRELELGDTTPQQSHPRMDALTRTIDENPAALNTLSTYYDDTVFVSTSSFTAISLLTLQQRWPHDKPFPSYKLLASLVVNSEYHLLVLLRPSSHHPIKILDDESVFSNPRNAASIVKSKRNVVEFIKQAQQLDVDLYEMHEIVRDDGVPEFWEPWYGRVKGVGTRNYHMTIAHVPVGDDCPTFFDSPPVEAVRYAWARDRRGRINHISPKFSDNLCQLQMHAGYLAPCVATEHFPAAQPFDALLTPELLNNFDFSDDSYGGALAKHESVAALHEWQTSLSQGDSLDTALARFCHELTYSWRGVMHYAVPVAKFILQHHSRFRLRDWLVAAARKVANGDDAFVASVSLMLPLLYGGYMRAFHYHDEDVIPMLPLRHLIFGAAFFIDNGTSVSVGRVIDNVAASFEVNQKSQVLATVLDKRMELVETEPEETRPRRTSSQEQWKAFAERYAKRQSVSLREHMLKASVKQLLVLANLESRAEEIRPYILTIVELFDAIRANRPGERHHVALSEFYWQPTAASAQVLSVLVMAVDILRHPEVRVPSIFNTREEMRLWSPHAYRNQTNSEKWLRAWYRYKVAQPNVEHRVWGFKANIRNHQRLIEHLGVLVFGERNKGQEMILKLQQHPMLTADDEFYDGEMLRVVTQL